MSASPFEVGLSPLDQIRQVEAEVTRRVAAARETAEKSLAQARVQVANCKSQARETGEREGQARHKEIIAKAEEEAFAYITQAQSQAARLRSKGSQVMDQAVEYAVHLVIGLEQAEKDPEPTGETGQAADVQAPVKLSERSDP